MTKSLMNKTLTQFAICVAVLMLLVTPVFYWLTKNFYAEDMIDIIEAVQQGQPLPALDLEQDILTGVMIQFIIIAVVVGVAIVVTLHVVSKRMWKPFDDTLQSIESFRLESGMVPPLPESDVREFSRLNQTLAQLMTNSLNSYRIQKEFTENASHELQTPLAILQSKIDLLMQQPDLNEQQAVAMQDMQHTAMRMSHLSRNLLLLAKMENSQFRRDEMVDVTAMVKSMLPSLEALSEGMSLTLAATTEELSVRANRTLMESMVNNLVVNAIRHNAPNGDITIGIKGRTMSIANTSAQGALDPEHIFNRFYRPAGQTKGNGLGLAIVKSVCDYHGWHVAYAYDNGKHTFTVDF